MAVFQIGQPLRARRPDVVLGQDIQQPGAEEADILGEGSGGQRHRGQDQVSPRSRAVGGQEPVQLDGEDEDEHQPEPEARHGLQKERSETTEVVGGSILVGGGHDAERDGEQRGEHGGGHGQLDGGGPEMLEHEVHGGTPLLDRLPEIAA
jgi:hypothetical protein